MDAGLWQTCRPCVRAFRYLTTAVASEMSYPRDLQRQAFSMLGAVLFIS
jgi:hypothetical protein